MFRLDRGAMRVLFTPGERDLALAYADIEGFRVVDSAGHAKEAAPPRYGESVPHRFRLPGVEPEQVYPGIFAYRVSKRRS